MGIISPKSKDIHCYASLPYYIYYSTSTYKHPISYIISKGKKELM